MQDSMHGKMTHSEFVVVRVRDDGVEGVGYTYALNSGKGIAALIEGELGPFLQGRDADLIEALWKDMWWHVHYSGRGGSASFAISAIDIALWDLKARKLGVPLWRLLGGHDPDVHAYAGSINFNFSIPELIEQNRQLVDGGFHAVKMRVGKETLREDIERVGAVRGEIGPDVHLMVDANMKWSVEEAIRRSRALAEHDVYWLEEPTIPDDVILNHITTKVMGYIRCARESVPHMIEAGGGRIINIGGMAARNSSPTNPGSGVTNSAMSNYSKALSDDVAADGILVNCIHPGSTRTERYMGLVEERAARSNITPEDELAQSVADIPIGRMIEPEDVANLAAFLCSDLASAITGQTIAVDGGGGRGVHF